MFYRIIETAVFSHRLHLQCNCLTEISVSWDCTKGDMVGFVSGEGSAWETLEQSPDLGHCHRRGVVLGARARRRLGFGGVLGGTGPPAAVQLSWAHLLPSPHWLRSVHGALTAPRLGVTVKHSRLQLQRSLAADQMLQATPAHAHSPQSLRRSCTGDRGGRPGPLGTRNRPPLAGTLWVFGSRSCHVDG